MRTAQNALSDLAGASVVFQTSETRGCSARNLLNDNPKRLWLSESGLPQEIIVKVSESLDNPLLFRYFGWLCWHSYKSNPAVVELASSEDCTEWKKLGTFKGKPKSGHNFFQIEIGDVRFVKITVVETFGAANTYMNQVFMVEEPVEDSWEGSRNSIDEQSVDADRSGEPKSPLFSVTEELRNTPQLFSNTDALLRKNLTKRFSPATCPKSTRLAG
jgi:hypothetical protein